MEFGSINFTSKVGTMKVLDQIYSYRKIKEMKTTAEFTVGNARILAQFQK